MQPAGSRRHKRRAVSYRAYIDVGEDVPARECTLSDASQEGALIVVPDPDSLPDEFILALSTDGLARRRCRVRWRRSGRIGVEFLKGFSQPPRPVIIPEPAPEPPAVEDDPPTAPSEPETATDWIDIETLSRT